MPQKLKSWQNSFSSKPNENFTVLKTFRVHSRYKSYAPIWGAWFFGAYQCVCDVFVCVCVCTGTQVCHGMYVEVRSQAWVPLYSTLLKAGFLCGRHRIHQADWPMSFLGLSFLYYPSCLGKIRIIDMHYCACVCVGSGDSNSGPHSCMGSI